MTEDEAPTLLPTFLALAGLADVQGDVSGPVSELALLEVRVGV